MGRGRISADRQTRTEIRWRTEVGPRPPKITKVPYPLKGSKTLMQFTNSDSNKGLAGAHLLTLAYRRGQIRTTQVKGALSYHTFRQSGNWALGWKTGRVAGLRPLICKSDYCVEASSAAVGRAIITREALTVLRRNSLPVS